MAIMKNQKLNIKEIITTIKSFTNRYLSGEVMPDKKTNFILVVNTAKIFNISIDIIKTLPVPSSYSETKLEDDINTFIMQNIYKTAETNTTLIIKYTTADYCLISLSIKKHPEEHSLWFNTVEEVLKRKYVDYTEKIFKAIQRAGEKGITLSQVTSISKPITTIQRKNILAMLEYENKIQIVLTPRKGKPKRTYIVK